MKKVYLILCFCLFVFSSTRIFAQAPPNDDCSGAILINTIPYDDLTTNYINASTEEATQSTPNPSCIENSDNSDDIWYKFVAVTPTQLLRIVNAVHGNFYSNFGYAIYDGCGGTELFCNNRMGKFVKSEMIGGLTPGNTYYLRIWSRYNYSVMTFSFAIMDIYPQTPSSNRNAPTHLTINEPGYKCISPQFYTTASGVRTYPDPRCTTDNDDEVWFQFSTNQDGQDVRILPEFGSYISTGGLAVLRIEIFDVTLGLDKGGCAGDYPVGSVTTMGPLISGHVYYMRIWTKGFSDRAVFSLCIQQGNPTPVNDICENAINLTVGTSNTENPVIGNLYNANTTPDLLGHPGCAEIATLKNDVWFKATVPASGNLSVQTSATNSAVNDVVMQAYLNNCTSYTEIACDDNGNPDDFPSANHSLISLTSNSLNNLTSRSLTGRTPGEIILFRVLPRTDDDKGQFSIAAFDNSVLPVVLTDFSATYRDKKVQLFWKTAEEHNTDYFEIERSLDGNHFDKTGIVPAKGISNNTSSYSFTDDISLSLISSGQLLTYRLKIYDKDKNFTYSKIVSVNIGKEDASIILSPNPAKNILRVSGLSNIGTANISIISSSGNVVKKTVSSNKDCLIDISNLSAGIYYVRVVENKKIANLKFVKE